MAFQDYVNLFGNGFFPIILCAFLLWNSNKHKDDLKDLTNKYETTLIDISTKHENTLKAISESLVLMNERIKDIETKGDKHGE